MNAFFLSEDVHQQPQDSFSNMTLVQILSEAEHIVEERPGEAGDEYVSPSIFDYAPPCSVSSSLMHLLEPTPLGPNVKVVPTVSPSSFLGNMGCSAASAPSRVSSNSIPQLMSLVNCMEEQQQPQPSHIGSSVMVDLPVASSPHSVVSSSSLTSHSSTKKSPSKRSSSKKYQDVQWNLRFQELLVFQKRHGHLLVPHGYKENYKLSQWVKRQRYQYRLKSSGRHNTLTDDREFLLTQVEFVWDSHQASWNDHFSKLEKFYQAYGHVQIPANACEEFASLSTWCKHQRRQYRNYVKGEGTTTMTLDRIRKMESIGFDWDPRNLA